MNCEKLQNPNCLCSDCVPELTSKVPYREAFQRGVEAGRRDVKQLRKELEEARQHDNAVIERCAIAALEAQMNRAEGGIYKSAAVAIRALRKTGEGDE